MEIFIYYKGQLGIPLDEAEDELDDRLIEFGGNVTGVGRGEMGGNLDIEIRDDLTIDECLGAIRGVLKRLRFPRETKLVIGSESHSLWDGEYQG